jgi:RNA-directed DNA polymerase
VKANKGAAGVDGLDIEQTAQAYLRTTVGRHRAKLLQGRYRPSRCEG